MEYSDQMVLVTGGTGFVGVHCVLLLLQEGYSVRTTLRNMKRKDEVLVMLRQGGIQDVSRLSFVETDLGRDDNWDKAVEGCTYVLHVASPIFLKIPKHEDEMIIPAVQGTLRVLRAARDAGVRRVVLTSSFGAVGYSQNDPDKVLTELDWTDPGEKGLSAYLKSKVLAEQAAWDFIGEEGGSLELAVINPVAIFGPSLGPDMSSGLELLKRMLEGSMKAVPRITMGIVDVRDVADLHLRAMTRREAKGERFLAISGGTVTLPWVAALIKNNLGKAAGKVSTRVLPNWLVRIAALFNPVARNLVPQLDRHKNASNEKAKRLLGWSPRSNEAAILAAAESVVRFGLENKKA